MTEEETGENGENEGCIAVFDNILDGNGKKIDPFF